ncbi:MAG TPA: caspase family protein [Ramlibacter sp.]|nr:caspase family protein [Ramlibacter sp.]
MSKPLTLLCVHGVGHEEIDPDFQASWTTAVTAAVQSCDPGLEPTIDFLEYDSLFDHAPLNALTYGLAFAKLLASTVVYGIGDAMPRARGLGEVPETVKWTAGMVAQWSTETALRARTRDAVLKKMRSKPYDAVFAHSLGSLICYDTFVRNPDEIKDKVYVSFGSQIGNPAVRDVFAGRIQPLAGHKWYHLFNPDDHVLTCPIKLAVDNFQQVTAQFDIPNDVLNHNATWYLQHANTVATVWRDLAVRAQPRSFTTVSRGFAKAIAKPDRRALLVGINDYPDPKNKLEGCVNDVFMMSSVLQESGFEPGEIRVVIDDRATAQGIMDRLHWLLDGVRNGDERVLFYSGHGAQIPGYGAKDEPDHIDECLVPYDFDWSSAHAILDQQFCELYSQLPYDSYFVAVFDCCHSGGMTRDGGPRIRGLTPPDDIRHRALRWAPSEQMWVPRDFPPLNRSLAEKKDGHSYLGLSGATNRLGRAAELRTMPNAEYDATRKALGHDGPYLPILLEACQEREFSYEYRHGATSYGAYTFCMAQVLRASRASRVNPSFEELNALVTEKLHRLKYNQTPALVGAKKRVAQQVPWGAAAKPVKRKKATRSRSK